MELRSSITNTFQTLWRSGIHISLKIDAENLNRRRRRFCVRRTIYNIYQRQERVKFHILFHSMPVIKDILSDPIAHNPTLGVSHSATQEICHLLGNFKVHYCFHKNPHLVPILSQMNQVHHTFQPCFSKIIFNIILPSMPRSSLQVILIKEILTILIFQLRLYNLYLPLSNIPVP
jgi:hypothetical protein